MELEWGVSRVTGEMWKGEPECASGVKMGRGAD